MKKSLMIVLFLFGSTVWADNIYDIADFKSKSVNKKIFYKNSYLKSVSLSIKKGGTLPEHKVSFDALLLCVKGKSKYFIGEKSFIMKEGDFHPIKKDSLHKIEAIVDSQFLLFRP